MLRFHSLHRPFHDGLFFPFDFEKLREKIITLTSFLNRGLLFHELSRFEICKGHTVLHSLTNRSTLVKVIG